MRLSTYEGDAGYLPPELRPGCRVLLDGKPLPGCTLADEELGLALAPMLDCGLYHATLARRQGLVLIVLTERARDYLGVRVQ